ncbi:MAG: PAS domain S-box protein [Methanomicrobiales archaeon]|nr:PAS domain S-box protein [Methanomicrobiales archaeon]
MIKALRTSIMVEDGEFLNRIRGLLKIYPRGLTISEISQRLKCNRNSVAKYLEILQISGTVEMQQMGAAKVFYVSQRVPISSLLGFTKEGIMVLSSDGRIIQINERFCRMFDLDSTGVSGMSYETLSDEILEAFSFGTYLNSDSESEHTTVVTFSKYDWRRYFKVKYIKTVFDDGRSGLTLIVEDVTLETEMEERLRMSEARYRGIVEDQTELICRYNQEGIITFANGAFCRLFRMNPAELVHHSIFEYIMPDAAQQLQDGMNSCSSFSPVFEFEFELLLPSDKKRWYHWVNRVLCDDHGTVIEFQGVGRDITDRKHTELELLIKSHAMDSSIVPIGLVSLEGKMTYVNRAFLNLWGYADLNDVIGLPFDHFSKGNDYSFSDIIGENTGIKKKEGHTTDISGIKRDGTPIQASVTISGVYNQSNEPICLIAYFYDVTHWVRILRELEIKDTAMAYSYEGMAIISPEGVVMYANPSFKRIFSRVPDGTPENRPIEWTLSFYPHIIGSLPDIRSSLHEKGNYTRVFSDVDEKGDCLVIQLHLSRVLDKNGSYLCTLISVLDITNQKAIEESLALMVDQLEGTVEQIGDPTFIISRDRMVVAWNEPMETLTGIRKLDVIGSSRYQDIILSVSPSIPVLVDLFDLPPKDLIQKFPHVSRVGNSFYTEAFVSNLHDGKGTYVWVKASPIVDTSGKVIGYIQNIKDMTNWKRAVESVSSRILS